MALASYIKLRVASSLELIARGGECHDCRGGSKRRGAEVVGAGGAVAGGAGGGAGRDGAERGAADAGGVAACVRDRPAVVHLLVHARAGGRADPRGTAGGPVRAQEGHDLG